jgi:hypothetical protein
VIKKEEKIIQIIILNTISMFEKKVTIYFSINPIEVEEDEIQIEMVEDLGNFVFLVIQKEVFESVVMNCLMSKKE